MKLLCVIVICFLLRSVSFAQMAEMNALPDSISHDRFILYSEVSKIEKKFVRFFERTSKKSLRMVNPTDTFNFTDLASSNPPNKRLIFGGKSASHTGFIVYQQGGNAQQYFCIVYKKQKKGYSYQLIRLKGFVDDIQELKSAISSREFEEFIYFPK